MFAQTNATSAASAAVVSSWLEGDHDLLLSTQDVLDYTPFSSDSHSPVLSIDSFSSTQQSPSLEAYCFDDFAAMHDPMPFAAAATATNLDSAAAATPGPLLTERKPTMDEAARQAALVHAYIAANSQNFVGNWPLPSMQQQIMEQKRQQEQEEQQRQQLAMKEKQQQIDADNLSRYLAQLQQQQQEQVKEENTLASIEDHTAMEEDHVSAPSSPAPSSSSSDGEKSPSSSPSPTLAERSLSPEASASSSGCQGKGSASAKTPRQLVCFNCKVTKTPLWRRTPDRQHSLCNACGLYYKQYGAHRPLHVRTKLPTVLENLRASSLPYGRTGPPSMGGRGASSDSAGFSLSIPSESSSSDSDSDSGPGLHSFPDLAKLYSQALVPPPPAQRISPPLMTAKQGIECANCSQTETPLWRKNESGEPICNACGLYAKLHNRDRPVTMRKSKIARRRRDWGGNLAHQAHAQAQALALAHVQAQVQARAQGKAVDDLMPADPNAVVTIVEEMSRKARELTGRNAAAGAVSSDSEEEERSQSLPTANLSTSLSPSSTLNVQQQQPQQTQQPANQNVTQGLSSNLIMDENKFADVVGQMNARQMNRFLSILETRCGVLRDRLLATTEATAGSQESSLDSFL
ncbi:hypothetical protein BGW38_005979 [Lunasporangiospora selenospora]|uniref:GATA-type domain-containing protein n=1 Tax=Lunasporangiospora selenospora TaxID=979761 RepID=A0A9P6FP95_9FUNG|nr:hypothetical protein BGW38_005979 [Lunasporangiospora selenospora]